MRSLSHTHKKSYSSGLISQLANPLKASQNHKNFGYCAAPKALANKGAPLQKVLVFPGILTKVPLINCISFMVTNLIS